jgi:predicted secreted protein
MATLGVRLGKGALVRIGRGGTPTWTVMSGVEDITFPDQARADVDVTAHDSPGNSEENIPGLFVATDWSVTKHYVPENAEDALLQALVVSGENIILEITPPGATVPFRWTAYVKNWLPTVPVKDAMKAELVLRVMARIAV